MIPADTESASGNHPNEHCDSFTAKKSYPQPSSLHPPIHLNDLPMDPTDPFFPNDAWAQEASVELMEVSAGRAKVRMRIAGWHMNSHGTVHGGAIFTLADTAFALASNSHGVPAAAINAHISYVKAATGGTLYAEAEEFSLNPKIATYTVTVTDDAGKKIAIFEGMVYRKTRAGRVMVYPAGTGNQA